MAEHYQFFGVGLPVPPPYEDVHYEPVKVTIDAPGLAGVILDVVVWHHGLLNSIVSDRGSIFTSKFWSSLCYFLGIKRRLSTASTLRPTERQNSTM